MARITWDEPKRQRVLRERGVDLLHAAAILDGPVLMVEDNRYDYGETRKIATGEVDGQCYTIVFVTRGDAFHIITAWRAGRRGRLRYQAHVHRGAP